MKKLAYVILLAMSVSFCAEAKSTLSSVIKKYSAEFGVMISYSPTLTGKVIVNDVPATGNIEQRLDALLAGTEFNYKESREGFYVFLDKKRVEERKRRIAAMEAERRAAAAEASRKEEEKKEEREIPEPGKMLPFNYGDMPANIAITPVLAVPKHEDNNAQRRQCRWFAIKTNALLLATTSVNLALETTIGKWLSTELAYSGNYWEPGFGSLKHTALMATLKYWVNGNETGNDYIGAYVGYGDYDIGELKPLGGNLERFRYDGRLYSAGIVYGHRFKFGSHFALETELGMGYVHVNYEKEDAAAPAGAIAAPESYSKNKFSITRAALNICYIF